MRMKHRIWKKKSYNKQTTLFNKQKANRQKAYFCYDTHKNKEYDLTRSLCL